MPNPYTLKYVDQDSYFVPERGGRGQLANDILQHILRNDRDPEPISLLGERRYGKTSILCYLKRKARDSQNVVIAFIDLLGLSPRNEAGFYAFLTENLILAGKLPEGSQNLTYLSFRRLLGELRRQNQRLVLLIDEFDVVARERCFEKSFFDNIRSLAQDFPLTMVVTSVAPLANMVHQDAFGSTFWGIFVDYRIGPLSESEATELVSQGGSADGLGKYTQGIIELAGYHPFFLQYACMEAWNIRKSSGGRLDMATLYSTFTGKVKNHYQYIWDHSTAEEQAALCAVVGNRADASDGLKNLQTRGYVHEETNQQLCGSGFAAFVKERCSAQTEESVGGPSTKPIIITQIEVDPGAPEQRLAIVIGVNKYLHQTTVPRLYYAEKDAQEMGDLLESLNFTTVKRLPGCHATYQDIKDAFVEIIRIIAPIPNPNSYFVFYFSGHGILHPKNDEKAYIMLYNTNSDNPDDDGLDMDNLVYDLLPQIKLPHCLVILDACHTGYAVGVKDAKRISILSGRWANVTRQVFGANRDRMVLAACPGEASARELPSLEHGVFTYYILKHWQALEGPHPSNCINFASLYSYVFDEMPRNHPDLPPPVWGGAGAGSPLVLRKIGY